MLKVLLCCLGGFSSGAMVQKIKKDISESEYKEVMMIEFHDFNTSFEVMDQFDIIMTCPHLRYMIPDFIKKYKPQIPIYTLPPKLYGAMTPKSIYEDCTDVIEGYKKDGRNPWHFEGEERTLTVKRNVSYRDWTKK